MLRLTLAQMRRSVPRLTAAGIAIVIGTAFVAATLLAGGLINRSVYDAIAAQYAHAGLVVKGTDLGDADVQAVRDTPGVAAADPQILTHLMFVQGSRSIVQAVIPTTSDARLMPLTVTEGRMPDADGEVALPPDIAQRLNLEVGDTVVIENLTDDGSGSATVVGLADDPRNAYGSYGGAAVMDAQALTQHLVDAGEPVTVGEVSVLLADGADLATVRDALTSALPAGSEVVTPHEHAQAVAEEQTGGQDVFFLVFVMTFAAIALLVAGLVITNTFQVLVAQRTRTLALLRAVGANKRQVGQGVLLEATLLGLISSALGVLLGCGLGQAALLVAKNSEAAAFLPTTITVTWPVVALPLLVGTAVTVLAALVPARIATRVSPLAALRPLDGPTLEKGSAGRVRLVLSLLMVFGGFALLAAGAALGAIEHDASLGLLAGVAGGVISFVGVGVSAVFWLPRVASWSGRLIGLTGPTARLAAANTLRNPRRTAATSTALLIGVTLVAMMSTGAASARTSLNAQLDGLFPVDVVVQTIPDQSGAATVPAAVLDAVRSADGVGAVARPSLAEVTVDGHHIAEDGTIAIGEAATPEQALTWSVYGVDPDAARAAVNDDGIAADLTAGTIVLPLWTAETWEVEDGDPVTLTGPDGSATFTAHIGSSSAIDTPLLTATDLAAVNTSTLQEGLWVKLAGTGTSAVGAIQDAVADTGAAVSVQGAAVERASYEAIVDTALGIVVGLLAVAVVIALIGVANTLSLSVLERRRESATLRAIGVTRGQLRWMLAVEGMLIAGVGAVLGIALGLVYGWAGSLAALGTMGPVELSVPWRDVALVAAIALVAGLVASVAPGRSAVRPSPVVALAAE